MEIIIINGPNLNLLGKRQPEIYGHQTFDDYLDILRRKFPETSISYYQSNHEGLLLDKLHDIGFDEVGIVLNAGAYTHTSIALADAIAAITAPVVEVHISDVYKRESFRHHSYITAPAIHCIVGQGMAGYDAAIEYLLEHAR